MMMTTTTTKTKSREKKPLFSPRYLWKLTCHSVSSNSVDAQLAAQLLPEIRGHNDHQG